jgi:hypothetical protein
LDSNLNLEKVQRTSGQFCVVDKEDKTTISTKTTELEIQDSSERFQAGTASDFHNMALQPFSEVRTGVVIVTESQKSVISDSNEPACMQCLSQTHVLNSDASILYQSGGFVSNCHENSDIHLGAQTSNYESLSCSLDMLHMQTKEDLIQSCSQAVDMQTTNDQDQFQKSMPSNCDIPHVNIANNSFEEQPKQQYELHPVQEVSNALILEKVQILQDVTDVCLPQNHNRIDFTSSSSHFFTSNALEYDVSKLLVNLA